MTELDRVWDLRRAVWQRGFRPVAVAGGQKFPTQPAWGDRARGDPPYWVARCPLPTHLVTGLLTDGLRAVDIDITYAEGVQAVAAWCIDNVGIAPVRFRENSPRLLMLYAAPDGEPGKASITNKDHPFGKQAVEVLGRGQQFVAFGKHPSGVDYMWLDDIGPHNMGRDELAAMDEQQVAALLDFAKQFVGEAQPRQPAISRTTAIRSPYGWHVGDIHDALAQIPNPLTDYDWWIKIGMAVFVASGGCNAGLTAWRAWSGGDKECDRKWKQWEANEPSRISGASLRFHARESNPRWLQPSRELAIIPNIFEQEDITDEMEPTDIRPGD